MVGEGGGPALTKQPVYSVVKAGSSTIMPMLSAPGPIFTAPVRPMLLVSSSTSVSYTHLTLPTKA